MRLSWTISTFLTKIFNSLFFLMAAFLHRSAIPVLRVLTWGFTFTSHEFLREKPKPVCFCSTRLHFSFLPASHVADLVHVSLRKAASFSTPQLHLKYVLEKAKGLMLSRHIVFCHNISPRILLLLDFCLQELFFSWFCFSYISSFALR